MTSVLITSGCCTCYSYRQSAMDPECSCVILLVCQEYKSLTTHHSSHFGGLYLQQAALLLLLLSHFSCDSVWPHGLQPSRLLHPWDSPGKNTGVGCHFLLQCMKVKSESEVAQSCSTLCNPMDYSLPGSSVHGIFQARVLEWDVSAFSETALSDVVMSPSRAGWPPIAVKVVNSSSSMFLSCDTTHWVCWQSWWARCSTCVTVVGPRGQRKLMQMSLKLWLLILPWIIKSLLSGSLKSLTGTRNNKLIC